MFGRAVELKKTMKWKIEYDNDTGPNDEGFGEWWTITDDDKSFKCYDEADAEWLCETLNASTPNDELSDCPPTARKYERSQKTSADP